MADSDLPEQLESAKKFLQCLAHLRDDPALSDVLVTVEDSEFACHRVFLAASSDFFRAAFQSDMKEKHEGKINLQDVDKKTFSTLLDFIYSGKFVITKHNLFDIWRAVDMLQMPLVLSQCNSEFDKLLKESPPPKTCVDYVCKLRNLSEKAKLKVLRIIIERFREFAGIFDLHLLDTGELKFVVSDDKLAVDSEDDVIEAVLFWADHKCKASSPDPDSDESKVDQTDNPVPPHYLADVLGCTRYLLISPMCLHGTLACHPLVKADARCQAIVDKICRYQAQPDLHQTWCPPAAVHRDRSILSNVLLSHKTCSNGKLICHALNAGPVYWKTLNSYDFDNLFEKKYRISNVLCCKSTIYFFDGNRSVYMYPTSVVKYQRVYLSTYSDNILFIGDSMYKIKNGGNNVFVIEKIPDFHRAFEADSVNWRTVGVVQVANIGMKIKAVANIGKTVILFYTNGDLDNYTVQSFDTIAKGSNSYECELGSSSSLVTFRHDTEVFALQENGCLWRIQLGLHPTDLQFSYELTLWDGEFSLCGAFLYKDELLVVGDFSGQTSVCEKIALEGVFKGVSQINHENSEEKPKVTLAAIHRNLY